MDKFPIPAIREFYLILTDNMVIFNHYFVHNIAFAAGRGAGMSHEKMGLLQNAAAQRREKNEKRKEEVFSYEND